MLGKGRLGSLKLTARLRRKANKRGVSPIIATILLVAITVVLAAVLYVLISGLTGSTATAPIALAPTVNTGNTGGGGTTWYVAVTVDPTASISTSTFGLRIAGTPAVALAAAAAPAGCTATANPAYTGGTTCTGVAGDWYAVLTNVAGNIYSVYTTAGWSVAVTITGGSWTLNIVSAAQLDGQGYVLSAYGSGATSVSGQVNL